MSTSSGDPKCACTACGLEVHGTIQRCGRCRVQPYCTRDCQKRDWPVHKLSCQSQAANASTQPPARAATADASSSPNGAAAAPVDAGSAPERHAASRSERLISAFAEKDGDALLEVLRERIRQDTADGGPTHPRVLLGHSILANACSRLGRHAEAVAAGRAALEPVGVLRGTDWPAFCQAMNAVCSGLLALGRTGDALPRCRDFCAAIAAAGDRSGLSGELADRLLLARCLLTLSMEHLVAGRRDEALQCVEETDVLYRADVASSPETARRAWAHISTFHGACLAAVGGHDNAALAVLARNEGACAPESEAGAAVHAALNLSSLGDHKEAQSAARRAVVAVERQPIASMAQAQKVYDDAIALLSQSQPECAVALFRRSLQFMVVQRGPSEREIFGKLLDTFEMLRHACRHTDAHLLALRAALSVETHEPAWADRNMTFWRMKAVDCLTSLGRHEQALRERRLLLPSMFTADGDEPLSAGWCFQKLAETLELLGRHDEALTHDLYALGLYTTKPEAIQVEFGTFTAWVHAAQCSLALGRPAEALPMLRRALALQRKLLEADAEVVATLQMIGDTLRTLGRHEEARLVYQEAMAAMQGVLDERPEQGVAGLDSFKMAQVSVDEAEGAMKDVCDQIKRLTMQKIVGSVPPTCDRSKFAVACVPASLRRRVHGKK